tara:strand:+ start:11594 stop:11782 length:189 start_codon:yes stop_codon:yes gene_type:complete
MKEDFSMFSSRKDMDENDYYLSKEGYIVFTEAYHLKRGFCCKSTCKHCPYEFEKKEKLRRKD